MARAKLNKAEILGNAPIVSSPSVQHLRRLLGRFDLRHDRPIPVIHEQQWHELGIPRAKGVDSSVPRRDWRIVAKRDT
jgi:hypothetical protein